MARQGSWGFGKGTRGRSNRHPLECTLDNLGGRSFGSDRHVAAAAESDPSCRFVAGSFRVRRGKGGLLGCEGEKELQETLEEKKENNDEGITKRRKTEIPKGPVMGTCLVLDCFTSGTRRPKGKPRHGIQQDTTQDTTAEIYLDATVSPQGTLDQTIVVQQRPTASDPSQSNAKGKPTAGPTAGQVVQTREQHTSQHATLVFAH